MRVRALLPDARNLKLEHVELDEDIQRVCIRVGSTAPFCNCPACGQPAKRVHSRYERKLTDLPWQGLRVHIVWFTRRFFCDVPDCPRRIFVERQPTVAAPYSRRTDRLSLAMRCIGLACGGEPGSRLAERLGILVSADTMLREIRRSAKSCSAVPRAVGVDDWAFCKGRRYGTLICDLETGRVLDLLPDRDAKSLATWLQGFKSVKVVSRDRSDIYRKGATFGAPDAIQVADRFHLMKNLREAFARFLECQATRIREALEHGKTLETLENDSEDHRKQSSTSSEQSGTSTTKVRQRAAENRSRRITKYNRVIELHRQGESTRSIATKLGMHRGTVRKFLRAGAFPERACRNYSSNVDRCANYLWDRWQSGCTNVSVLWREIRENGFNVSYHSVRRFVRRWRKTPSSITTWNRKVTLSANEVSWLLFKKQSKLCDQEVTWKRVILEHCGDIRATWHVTRRFIVMLRKRKGKHLARWFAMATKAEIPPPIRQFAEGLKNDWAAVTASLNLPWNNGAAEGHISKLKMIKRQMYGRAKFDLLRARVLAAG